MGAREDFAKRVAFNLFRYIESFGGRAGDQIMVPTNVLDQWFTKFQEKFRRDPDFLARQEMPV
jgi:protein Hikeshi